VARLVTLSTLQSRVQQRTNMQQPPMRCCTRQPSSRHDQRGNRDYGQFSIRSKIRITTRERYVFYRGNVALYAIGLGNAIPVADFMKVISIDVAYGQTLFSPRGRTWSPNGIDTNGSRMGIQPAISTGARVRARCQDRPIRSALSTPSGAYQ